MYPFVFVAAALALYFAASAFQSPRTAKIIAAVLWGAYSVYEYYVANGTLCDANCNIRVDLVLFLPILAAATVLGFKKDPGAGAVAAFSVLCLALVAVGAGALGYTVVAAVAGIGAVISAILGVIAVRAPKST